MAQIASFSISSDPLSFTEIYPAIDEIVARVGLTGRGKFRFAVCVTEAFTNACLHGNRRDPDKKVAITFAIEANRLIVSIEDEGQGRATDIPQAFAPKQIKSEKFSGRGVAIMREFADNFTVIEKTETGLKIRLEWELTGDSKITDVPHVAD